VVFERLTEARAVEQRADAARHAAADVDAADRLEHEREVAGEAAEQPHE
jgi:hypothetical protein